MITTRFHPTVFIGPVGLALAGLVGAVVASSISAFSSDALLIIWLTWGLLLFYAIGKVLRWVEGYFVVTSQRMLVVKGLLAWDMTSVPNTKMGSTRFRRSVLGRMLGYGQLIIEADRIQPVWTVNFLPYPEQLYLEMTSLVFRPQDIDD